MLLVTVVVLVVVVVVVIVIIISIINIIITFHLAVNYKKFAINKAQVQMFCDIKTMELE